jgi:hypothetical protein
MLILDDVGTAHVRAESLEWLHGIYWRILDHRADTGRRTVITTNLTLAEVGVRIGPRAMSRLMGMMGSLDAGLVDLTVSDYRLRGWRA